MFLTTLATWAKDNPLLAFGGTVVAIVGGTVVVDERYAKAADVRSAQSQISGQLEINRLTAEVSVLEIRRATLQDKVYEGAARAAVTRSINPAERAISDRYGAELRDIERQIADKRRLLDQLRTR